MVAIVLVADQRVEIAKKAGNFPKNMHWGKILTPPGQASDFVLFPTPPPVPREVT